MLFLFTRKDQYHDNGYMEVIIKETSLNYARQWLVSHLIQKGRYDLLMRPSTVYEPDDLWEHKELHDARGVNYSTVEHASKETLK